MTDQARLARPNKMAAMADRALAKVTWFARPLPDAVMIGSGRAGSTALYAFLIQHPQIKGPFRKEVHYLDLNWERGSRWYRTQFPLSFGRRDWLAIESTPAYLAFPPAVDRMHETAPNARFLMTVRDPVARAVSHWKFRTQRGLESRSLDDVIEAETNGEAAPFRDLILTHGMYAEHLERWFARFDREQFHITDAHVLFEDPQTAVNDVVSFLGLKPHTKLGRDVRNASRVDATPSDGAVERLRELMAPHDEHLADLLGRRFSWMD